jgi:cation-transporting ATPase 13A1
VGVSAIAYSGATNFFPELNRWLQLVDMTGMVRSLLDTLGVPADTPQFKLKLTLAMIIDFGGCYIMETGCKYLFADLEPGEMVTRGRERREKRRAEQERVKAIEGEKAGQGLPELEAVKKMQ